MERRVKERLIGASILVVLIVLVVPELLSGPKPPVPQAPAERLPAAASMAEPIRTVTVEVATRQATSAVNADATAILRSAPAADTPVETALPSANLEPTTLNGEAARAPMWAVQLGSFVSSANADKLVHQLKAQGFAVYVLASGSGGPTRHRVLVGPLPDRGAAERTAAKLKALGRTSTLVSPGS